MDITTSTNVDEINIVNPINPALSDVDKLKALEKLTQENIDFVRAFLEQIDTKFGTKSKYSIKEPQRIVERLPGCQLSVLGLFGIEHVTDTFRFQTIVSNLNVVPKIVQELKIAGVEVIRTNSDTMLKPTRFGWRMITLDLRFKTDRLLNIKYLWRIWLRPMLRAIKIFEKWRDKDLSQLNGKQRAEYAKDRRESKNIYSKAWRAYVQRTSQTDNQVASILIELHNAISNN